MTLSKKHIFIVIFAGITIFFTGLVVGFLLSNRVSEAINSNEEQVEKHTYKCTSTVYISKTASEKTSISSADLEAEASEIDSVLERDILLENVKKKTDKQYPDTEYSVELEHVVENTQIYHVIVTGDSKEQLQEICDLATLLLSIEIETTMSNVQCKIVEQASNPQRN